MKKRQLADKGILYIKDKVKIFHGCFYQARATNQTLIIQTPQKSESKQTNKNYQTAKEGKT